MGRRRQRPPNAEATLTAPAEGATYTAGGGGYALVTFTSSDHYVEITGGTAYAYYYVQWSMQLEVDTTVLYARDWDTTIIQLDGMGDWRRNANGTGSLSQSNYGVNIGNHTGKAYAELQDQNNSANKDVATDPNNFTVQ